MTVTISAATRIASINRRASRGQRPGLGWPAVVLQWAQHGVAVVPIIRLIEITGVIAAQVVAIRGHSPVAVAPRSAVGDNAVLERRRPGYAATGAAEAAVRAISADGAVANQRAATGADTAADCVAAGEIGAITADGAVANRQRPATFNAASFIGAIPADGALADGQLRIVEDAARIADAKPSAKTTGRGGIPADGAIVDRQRAGAVEDAPAVSDAYCLGCAADGGAIPADGAAVDRKCAAVPNAATPVMRKIASNCTVAKRQCSRVGDTRAINCNAVPDGHRRKADMRGTGNCDHPIHASAINNGRRGSRTHNRHANADGQILCIGRGGHDDGVAGGSKRDGMLDGFAGCGGRCAGVAVSPAHPIHVPCGAGDSGSTEKQSHQQ